MAAYGNELTGIPDGLRYWIPGEMVVVVRLNRHPVAEAQDVLVEQVQRQLSALLAQYDMALEPYGHTERWRNVTNLTRRSFVFGRHRPHPLIAIFFHVRQQSLISQDPLPLALAYIQANLEQLAQGGLHIVSAMPNWLVTAAPASYGGGGPALPPVPAPAVTTLEPPGAPHTPGAPTGWHLDFAEPGLPLDPKGAEDVLVVVLDTARHPRVLQAAATHPDLRRNWLLQQLVADLRSGSGSFEIEYERYPIIADVSTGQDRYGQPGYYGMPDHGLFVSGIIRSLASRSRIRLIRILNDYGGCDLYNLFAALTDLEQEVVSGAIRRLVINLSLTTMPDVRRLPYIWFNRRQWPSTQLAGALRVLSHIEEGLRLLFESLNAQGVLIVAAAGNDSYEARKQGQRPRPPRSPARYESVLSVSSVNSHLIPSLFANAACLPPSETGIATFGGDVYGKLDTNSLPDAVRGLYISSTFPNGEQNRSGWADWAGTSFSTAIISALGAHLMSQDWSAANAITRIVAGRERRTDRLFGPVPEAPELLANVIRVEQRFGSP
jgi:hypothetical protein